MREEEIIFVVEEDPDGGVTARALGHSIFTEAVTIDELKQSVLDALRCHYDSGGRNSASYSTAPRSRGTTDICVELRVTAEPIIL